MTKANPNAVGRTKEAKGRSEKRSAAQIAKKLARWKKVSPLGHAMADKGVAGSKAVGYLMQAFGVGRTRAYDLIRGSVEPDETQIRVLLPLIERDGVDALLRRREEDAVRRAVDMVTRFLRGRGETSIADALDAYAVKHLGA